MNTLTPVEEVTVYSDLLNNSEDKFLDKIPSNLNNIGIFEKEKAFGSTYSSFSASIRKYVRQQTQLPVYKNISHRKQASFQVEQEWEGYVQEINDNNSTFTALLLDITANQKYPTEEADFRQQDIVEFDRHFLCRGAVFRWIIGYEGTISGPRKSVSKLIFRRLPKFSKDAIKRADKKAQQFKEGINWE